MQEITITEKQIQEKIMAAIPWVLEEMFTRTYSNPVREAIESSIKEKNWEIKVFVQSLLWEIINDAWFKDEVKTAIVSKILTIWFK